MCCPGDQNMSLSKRLVYFTVYCILQGSAEIIPEIAYEFHKFEKNLIILPLNQIPKHETGYDTFVLMENRPAIIAIYEKGSSYVNIGKIRVNTKSNYSEISTDSISCERGPFNKCYIKIDKISSQMERVWVITLTYNGFPDVHKPIKIHIRPERVPQITIEPKGTWLTAQTAQYTFKDFDAFACLLYDDNYIQGLNWTCQHSPRDTSSVGHNTNFIVRIPDDSSHHHSSVNNINKNNLELEQNEYSDYIDCVVQNYGEINIVRIFLLFNRIESSSNNTVKPTSNNDLDGCLNYVNCLHDPEVQEQGYCFNPTNDGLDSTKEINIHLFSEIDNTIVINEENEDRNKLKTYTVFENEPAVININHTNVISVADVRVIETNTQRVIPNTRINEEIENLYSVQIKNIYTEMSRVWECQINLTINDYPSTKYYKFYVHIRSNEDDLPRIYTKENTILIQRARYMNQDYDGFGCLVFNGATNREIFCQSSNLNIVWKPSKSITGYTKNHCDNTGCKYDVKLSEEVDRSYIDCVENQSEDTVVVRLFLIQNKTEKPKTKPIYESDEITPSSEQDRIGCLNYVNLYHSPINARMGKKISGKKPYRSKSNNNSSQNNQPTGNRPTNHNHNHVTSSYNLRPRLRVPTNRTEAYTSTNRPTTVFFYFKDNKAWPPPGTTTNLAISHANTNTASNAPAARPNESGTQYDFKTIIGIVLTILVVLILIITVFFIKKRTTKHWKRNETISANANGQNAPNNVYVDPDTGIVHYSNNLDIYAKPISKSERNKHNNTEQGENSELIDNSIYGGGDIYAEPNQRIAEKPGYTGDNEYSYAYAECVNSVPKSTDRYKNDEYAVINKKGKEVNKNDTNKDNADYYSYIDANYKSCNKTSKDYVNAFNNSNTDNSDNLNNTEQTQNETYGNIGNGHYVNPANL